MSSGRPFTNTALIPIFPLALREKSAYPVSQLAEGVNLAFPDRQNGPSRSA